LEELDAEERQLAEVTMQAARALFAGFEEKPGSDYHRAADLTAEQTWAKVAEELGRVSALATLEGYRDRSLEVADIELIHKGIFEPVFGQEALCFRSLKKDRVEFPIVMGSREKPHLGVRRGTGGKQVRQNLGKALKARSRSRRLPKAAGPLAVPCGKTDPKAMSR
jgi:hypothetical protein